ncbi:MAG: VPS10 domain-containing protein [Terriglobales bacterium]
MRRRLLLVLAAAVSLAAAQINPALFAGLRWRNIGPMRAGRVAAVAGVIGHPGVFYIGLPGGGVWKTDDAGVTWHPIFDSVKEVDSIGSLAIATSDPRIIYAGTGDLITGLALNEGNGMYKSTDGGRTWQQSGLEHTHRIPRILVDPHNPDLVLAATQGDYHFKSRDRGVYRSTDGGATWTKVLYRDDMTGARDMDAAFDDPTEVFATTCLHYNPNPGQHKFYENGTALYKSTDEGATWTEISGHGLPALRGRMAVAVAPHTHGRRVYLVGGFGLYRSDDAGATWIKATSDRRVTGNDYICGVYVDTHNPDIVYVMQTAVVRSTDGGHTFASFKGAPGGDDYHEMWIDPTNPNRMILGVDQGATVSLDHGLSWSPWYNQSTAQVYRIATDNRFPYWVYATQQDTGAVAVASRGKLGEITPFDWYPLPAGEAGSVAPDPLNPNVIYIGGLESLLVKVVRPMWTVQDVSPGGNGKVYREFTNPPISFLPQDAHVMLFGTQYVSLTRDGGQHWRDISPDLSAHNRQPPVPPAYGRPTPALSALSPSPAARGEIWAGTNTGLVWLTRDMGAHWTEVTPRSPGLGLGAPKPGQAQAGRAAASAPAPDSAEFNFVQPSHTNPAEAYAEMDNRNVGDYQPYIFRTRDYGAHWTKIVSGLPTGRPEGSFVRVVREDPEVPGLLYCGTENTVYVSLDDGNHWQSLRQNLPTTSIRDLVVHGNDLVVGTYGRGFWILDGMSPLRQLARGGAARIEAEAAHLFVPGGAVRVHSDRNRDTPFPPEVPHRPNPPNGAILYFWLSAPAPGPLTITIRDAAGALVRTLSSVPDPALAAFAKEPQTVPDYWKQPLHPLATGAGMHRAVWDLRYERPPGVRLSLPMTALPHGTAPAPQGPLVLPGIYTVTLHLNGQSDSQKLTVRNDPRNGSSPSVLAALGATHALEMKIMDGLAKAHAARQQAASAGQTAAVQAVEGAVRGFGRPRSATPTLAGAQGELTSLLGLLESDSDAAPTAAQAGEFQIACRQLNAALTAWGKLAGDAAAAPALLACDH